MSGTLNDMIISAINGAEEDEGLSSGSLLPVFEKTAAATRVDANEIDKIASALEWFGTTGVQSFVELDDNRIVSEDLLVKHFLPGRVSAKITLSGVTDAQALAAVESFLEALDPASTLEVSDLVKALYDAGATYVQLPITLVVLTPSQDRILTGTTVQDRVPLERTRHFVLETGGLTVTVSS